MPIDNARSTTAPEGSRYIEVDASHLVPRTEMFDDLRNGAIVVLRNLPEIDALGQMLRRLAYESGSSACEKEFAELMKRGEVASIETHGAFHRAFRYLRDSRYLSCLFADRVASFGLPSPLLIDTGFCRMVASAQLAVQVGERPDLFSAAKFEVAGRNEAEGMLSAPFWGSAHRDIDVRHNHFQVNFWFPLHDIEAQHSLLLFPDAYRRDVQQYGRLGDPNRPDEWGFGRSLQVPLKFGSALLFHSQQLHASPNLPPSQSRFTVELRVASGCIDDNARIYRRLFWKIENFRPIATDSITGVDRAKELTESPGEAFSLDYAMAGRTAQAVVHRLFRHAAASLAAAYVHRGADIFDDVRDLDKTAWSRILQRLSGLPCGEDLWLMVARITGHRGHIDVASEALRKILDLTGSYFWALEGGRIAAGHGIYGLAASLFDRAHVLAIEADVALDRYTPNMPPPRSRSKLLQLQPSVAARAATAFARSARLRQLAFSSPTTTFDWRLFHNPARVALASYEHYDLVSVDCLIVALPAGKAYRPERLIDDEDFLVSSESVADMEAMLGRKLGRKLPHPLLITAIPCHPRNYLLASLIANYVVRPLRALRKLKRS